MLYIIQHMFHSSSLLVIYQQFLRTDESHYKSRKNHIKPQVQDYNLFIIKDYCGCNEVVSKELYS